MIIPSLKCVAWNARLVVVGFAAGTIEKIPANLLLLKQVSVVGLFWGGNTSTSLWRSLISLAKRADDAVRDPQHAIQVVFEVLEHLSTGKLKPILFDKEYNGLETVSQGLQDLEGRLTWGKGVIRIRDEGSSNNKRESKL